MLSLMTTFLYSSNFNFSNPRELLIVETIESYDSGREDNKISALISSLKLTLTELN
ncbi:hypothetical protein MANES_12G041459v8 [Manihot esculenta]|uniref:Uncharacterized protein n=1 Tax=Manihot esculenta TaxID=3983 RepID=A0ACB7GPP6_MANES|nr:hypothetical protein MANES_12G041459v8 [Manihot esculenta]